MSTIISGRRSIVRQSGTEGTGGSERVWLNYGTHLNNLYLWYEENSWAVLVGVALLTVQGQIMRNNWHIFGL